MKINTHTMPPTQTMTTVLNSQMFERFVEERLADPGHPQIKVMIH